ncbi:MAG: hypothetical protein KJ990_01905 [Proteobacteria bacterium]|nr:hypothetical protein [Pseudomonadota bacterium]MBU1649525.1 hypothetical protein [Pseudomonadota bacterium]
MIFFLTAFLIGCEPQTRHKTLTFFFTGVPPIDEPVPIEKTKEQPVTPPAEILKKPTPVAPNPLFSHPVWAAGTCTPCHASTGSFRAPGVKKSSPDVFKTGAGMPGKLTLATNKICTQCHKDKTPKRALSDNLWLHNSTAKGDCMACHDPHQSKNKNILRQAPSILCLSCHKEGQFLTKPVHQKKEECLSCHNPHMGIDKNLLTKDYKEIKTPAALVPEGQEPGR